MSSAILAEEDEVRTDGVEEKDKTGVREALLDGESGEESNEAESSGMGSRWSCQ